MLNWKVLPVTMFAGLFLVACAGQETVPPSTPPPSSAMSGEQLYAARCVFCHGESRQGTFNSGGALTPDSLAARSDAALREIISAGIAYTNMPSFKNTLSLAEIDAIVQFIKYTTP